MTVISLYDQRKWHFDPNLIIFWLASIAILLFSFHQQYNEKIEPCSLCKWQRDVYFFVAAFAPIGFIQRWDSFVRIALNFIFFCGFCLAAYHILIQFGWLSDRCAITQKIENMNDFMKMLEQPKVSCANVGWKLFGLSASIYNIILSFCALVSLNFNNIKRLIHER